MEHNKDIQAAFMDALNALKEYAKVNGNIVGKEDVAGFFKDMSLDDNKYSMITGYLMANGITIKGEDGTDNEFLHMLESTVDDSVKNDEKGIALENEYKSTEDDAFTEKQVTDKDGLITKINISEEEVKSLPEKEAAMAAQMIADNMDYSEDDIYIERYKKELEAIQPVSDTTRAYLLVNIVEHNDKESLKILSESYLSALYSTFLFSSIILYPVHTIISSGFSSKYKFILYNADGKYTLSSDVHVKYSPLAYENPIFNEAGNFLLTSL